MGELRERARRGRPAAERRVPAPLFRGPDVDVDTPPHDPYAGIPDVDPNTITPYRSLDVPAPTCSPTPYRPPSPFPANYRTTSASSTGTSQNSTRPARTRNRPRAPATTKREGREHRARETHRGPAESRPDRTAEPERMTVRIGWDTAVHRPATIPDLRDCAPAGTPVGDDDPRMLYHGTLGPVATADIDHGLKVARRLLRANRQTTQTPAHAAVDGERGSGKTTLLHVVGRAHQGRVEKWHGIDANRIPVVCINTPPTRDDLVNWSAQIAVFLGWDLYRRDPDGKTVQRTKDWTGPVVHVLRAAKTRLLLVDGIDRLRTGDIGPAFAFLDFLAAELGLTVLWCGTGSREVLREARGDPDTDTGTLLPRNAAPPCGSAPSPTPAPGPNPGCGPSTASTRNYDCTTTPDTTS
ncbi:TniB family NTP-binding protein [Embleya sp. MST-111070]|uniref:TniB family NTP-binding protein n=1 Tax=Embleya sp. MST-111070 TaxID=3398231 RepID=UPI003F740CC7